MKSLGNLLIALVLIGLVLNSHSAPSSRRKRAQNWSSEDTDTSATTKLPEETTDTATKSPSKRRNKALNLFGYYPSFLSSGLDYTQDDDEDVTFGVNDENFDEDDLSRTIPSQRRQQSKKKNGNGYKNDNINSLQYDNSPIYVIRLPPTPYMFVPGLGYVSQPPSMGPPMAPPIPQNIAPEVDPFINLPLDFVSNGKPTGVYQWGGAPAFPQMPPVDPFGYVPAQPMMPAAPQPSYNIPTYTKPKPKPAPSNSKLTNLKGQYVFNGKPGDNVFVLRDTYNSIYSDALQNFYP